MERAKIDKAKKFSGGFQFVARATDSLLRVTSPAGPFLVLTELQFEYDEQMPLRLAMYAFLARHKYGLPVYVVVVYFTPPPAKTEIVETFEQECLGQIARQDFQPILLWELDAEQVVAYDNPALLPFVPLMKGGNTEQMLRQCAERIRQEPQAAELETVLALFASRVLDAEVVKQIVRWKMDVIEELPLMQEFREKWLERGEEKGERKISLEYLYQILTTRFNVKPGQYDDQFKDLDLPSLKKLHQVAFTAQTFREFEAALTALLTPPTA